MKAEIKDKETGETYHIELDEPIGNVNLLVSSFEPSDIVNIEDTETMKVKLKDKETGETIVLNL